MSNTPGRQSVKKRSYTPQTTLKSKFESAVYKITGSFLETAIINHSLTKGEAREIPLIEFLKDNLPKTYSIVQGEVVDIKDSSSPQMDIMIYDNSRNIPFLSGEHYILPAEALLASIEIKSKLNQEEIRKILKNTEKLKSLQPFGQTVDISKNKRTVEEKVTCRYFHSVFAYETDISKKDWMKKEFERIKRVANEENIDSTLLDRLYVLNKGFINTSDSVGKESEDNADTFLHFYMNLLNFLQRENARRKTVPYLDYAGKLTNGWEKL